MFWKETPGLKNVDVSSKIAISAFLVIAGIGYLFGFMNIYLTYSPVDEKPGLSLTDVSLSFYGSRDKTQLEKAIDGTMKEYFASEKDYTAVKDWIKNGASEARFAPVQAIFDSSCLSCHSKDAAVAGVMLDTYADVEPHLSQDTGKSVSRLVSISHTHILGVLSIVFILTFIFAFTSFSQWVKITVMSLAYGAIVLDVGSWWLAKLAPGFAVVVILGGMSLGLSFFLLVVLPLYEIWLKKEKKA